MSMTKMELLILLLDSWLTLILKINHEFTISYSYISSIILYLEGFRDPIRYLEKCLCTF